MFLPPLLLPENAMILVRSAQIHLDAGMIEEARKLAARAADTATSEEREEVEREVRMLLATLRER